ncbi:efflux RND transporter permease subunit [Alteromonas stellipolaris]|uniref:efflux RND transporter permease subunit n=1 Tax=Alteromonas stellipolaris TaxID=233316 RepID=UPI003562938D
MMAFQSNNNHTGLIAYFAKNPVAANLLMTFIVLIGLLSYLTVKQQLFPSQSPDSIRVSATLPGASAKEVEELFIIKVEATLKGIPEIENVISNASRGQGRLTLRLANKSNQSRALEQVKTQVASIETFPISMSPPLVTLDNAAKNVMEISLVGDIAPSQLKLAGQKIKDELLLLDQVSLVELLAPKDEIAIEISPDKLRAFNLTIHDVSASISNHSLTQSAGMITSDQGNIAIRADKQALSMEDFASIPVKYGNDSGKVLLGEIAHIARNYVDGESYLTFSGRNAVSLIVNATEEQSIVDVASSVKQYIIQKNLTLPPGMMLETLVDYTYYLDARLQMMISNLLQGACLIALLLTIFLRFRLAMWVMAGLPICFFGAVMLMPLFGLSINIISLFAFIMVLGIVVDDAIVTAESVYTEVEAKGSRIDNVIAGVKKVATPATFGVITTMAVFFPFVFSSGPDSATFFTIAMVAILCLVFSLVESKLILPAHLSTLTLGTQNQSRWRARFNGYLNHFIKGPYQALLQKCIHNAWLTLTAFIAVFVVTLSLVTSNRVQFVANPSVPHDFPMISIQMTNDSSVERTIETLKKVERVVRGVDAQTQQEFGKKMVRDILALSDGRTASRLIIPLVNDDSRPYDTFELSRRWREAIPTLPGVKAISIKDDLNGSDSGGDFGYRLYGADIAQLRTAASTLVNELREQNGLVDINSSVDMASKEIQLSLKPVAYDMGLTLKDVATQVGFGFYGSEAQRVMNGNEEVRVLVRYPSNIRREVASLQYARVTSPSGQEVMLGDIAALSLVPGASTIRREEGVRNVYVWGSVDASVVSPHHAVTVIKSAILPMIMQKFPGVSTELGGDIQEQNSQMSEQLLFLCIGVIGIYIMLAVPLKSYVQPLLVLIAIPLSYTGAVLGHYLFSIPLSTMSVFGLVAAAGVVINDSLVMIDYINNAKARGIAAVQAIMEAGRVRFRPILITSLTTFAGVLPLMFETSLQAKLIVPMAVSLGWSVLFATLISLLLLPALFVIYTRGIQLQLINRSRSQLSKFRLKKTTQKPQQ